MPLVLQEGERLMVERRNGILLVVDDASLRAGLSLNLRVEGYEVFTAPREVPSGLDGLSKGFAVGLLDADAAFAEDWARELTAQGVRSVVLCRPEVRQDWRTQFEVQEWTLMHKPFALVDLLVAVRRSI